MALTHDDVRVELGFSTDDWSADDQARADALLARTGREVRRMVGQHRAARAEADNDEPKMQALDDAALVLAVGRFANPERALQRRQGPDASVSFADSNEAATLRKEAREILRAAFGDRAVTVTL